VKISDARVIVSSPGRNYVTLVIQTEDGLVGVGDATLNGRELAVASYLRDHVCPLLVGRDARRIEDTWQYLYKGAYWRRGPVTMTSIAAVDIALWDIKGKIDVPWVFRTARFVVNSCGELPIHELVADLAWRPVLES
jgi:mannonate dehydratase